MKYLTVKYVIQNISMYSNYNIVQKFQYGGAN